MADKTDQVLPLRHLALIPDGDRRWARSRGLPPLEGHRRGAENISKILETCHELDIHYLSMWGFSTENWNRAPEEVALFMDLFRTLLKVNRKKFIEQKVRFHHIGRRDRLPQDLLEALRKLEEDTAQFSEWHYITGLDYGGQDEIVRATKKIVTAVQEGSLKIEDLTIDTYQNYLDTAGIPNPDFFIRTSGEQRTSGFMPYQMAYTEFYFAPYHFPDLTPEKLKEAVAEYYSRQRRFGAG